jgi:CheY-like chemotaxis protein
MRADPWNHEEVGVTSATSVERTLILIVEDDEDSREVYTDILVNNGFEVETTTSGVDGLRLARELHPGAILMDVSLPDLDGWSVTAQLKADPETVSIPVIVVTAYAFPEDRARANQVGCEGFLTKPCEPSRVLAEIQWLLRR